LQKQQPRLDPKRLVFIDETSVSTTITRVYGRATQGERLVQKLPHGNWKTVTFIAALRHDRVTAPFCAPRADDRRDVQGLYRRPSPSGAYARLSPPVSIKSPEVNAPRTSQIQDMVNLNGERFNSLIVQRDAAICA
jgi:hypothetical protein